MCLNPLRLLVNCITVSEALVVPLSIILNDVVSAGLDKVNVPLIVVLPNIPVDPVILTLLPDMLVNRYVKLPSPSAYDSADPFTNLSVKAIIVCIYI
jgi:hypothetical protein